MPRKIDPEWLTWDILCWNTDLNDTEKILWADLIRRPNLLLKHQIDIKLKIPIFKTREAHKRLNKMKGDKIIPIRKRNVI